MELQLRMEQPSKPPRQPKPRSKAKKVTVSLREKWEQILRLVPKNEVPVEVLQSLTVNLTDGTKVNVDIRELLAEFEPCEVEDQINSKLRGLDDYIVDVDFFIDIDTVAATIQPVTDKLLRNL